MKYILLCLAMCITLVSFSQTYHLFKPIPKENMREFALDRPDVTESPQTVDAGHFQFEGDVVKWTKETPGNSPRTINLWNGLYKMGLAKNWDIHLGYELFNIDQDSEGKKVADGAGAFTVRLKRNFWGNEGDTKTALGAIPYVTFVDDEVQYGIGFPFSSSINDNLGWGAQPQVDFVPNGAGGHDLSFFQTVVLGGTLVGAFDFYVEGLAVFATNNQFLANGGIIYNATANMKFDVATNIGLNKYAPTKVYMGFSFRL
jgi:hypothetical protein